MKFFLILLLVCCFNTQAQEVLNFKIISSRVKVDTVGKRGAWEKNSGYLKVDSNKDVITFKMNGKSSEFEVISSDYKNKSDTDRSKIYQLIDDEGDKCEGILRLNIISKNEFSIQFYLIYDGFKIVYQLKAIESTSY